MLSILKLVKHLLQLSLNDTDNSKLPAYLAQAPVDETQLQ